ncbi:MAG: hypothetical protein BYD32DRAFT_161953 [Podila humilis]|nr:MAG: hypothetical protein BYD32DRAFT_161953 [Podila humilis]
MRAMRIPICLPIVFFSQSSVVLFCFAQRCLCVSFSLFIIIIIERGGENVIVSVCVRVLVRPWCRHLPSSLSLIIHPRHGGLTGR